MSKRLRKGDRVMIVTGNERGKLGKILSCSGKRVVVEGINVRKKHMKKKQENQRSQIIDIECPIHISNVRFCPGDTPAKMRVRKNKNRENEIYYLDKGKQILHRSVKKAPA